MFFVRSIRSSALMCALLLLVCALLAHPFAEIGGNDDFAYVRSAKILAETGHIVYVGWSSAMLGWQLALGAAFIKLFGFSFTVTRMSILSVGLFTAALLQRTAVRLGLNEWNATLVTLTLVLSPLFLALSVSFMSDIPGVLAIVAALYCCARAMQEQTPNRVAAWLTAAAILSTVLGTARQTGWLGILIVVPCTCWVLRKRELPWPTIACVWLACVFAIFGSMRWFSYQMYSTAENAPAYKSGTGQAYDAIMDTLRLPLEIAFFLAPLFFAFALEFFRGSRRAFYVALAITALLCAFFLLRLHGYWASVLLVPAASGDGNYVTQRGILELPMLGKRPVVLGPLVRLLASIVCYFSAAVALVMMYTGRRHRPQLESNAQHPTWRQLLFVVGCFALFYCGLMSARIIAGNLFDRYLLPLFVACGLLVARYYQERIRPRLPAACYAVLVPIAAFGVAALHDMFAADRARLAAISELTTAGVSPSNLYGGFAFDGWTQIDNEGYIDVNDIRTPAGIHHISKAQAEFKPCGYWPAADFPTIHPQWVVSYDRTSCGQPQHRFPPVTYRLWLAPRTAAFYILSLDPGTLHQPTP